MWSTIGHQKQKHFLDNALNNKTIAHAYLFCGPNGVGKKTLAIEFAYKILGIENRGVINPDLLLIEQDKLKIEDMRKLINELSLKPYAQQFKVAIIDNLEGLTTEGANSILKTLEEPNPSTIIILVARNKKNILPTIISRCQIVFFSRLTTVEAKKINVRPEQQSKLEDDQKSLTEVLKTEPVQRLVLIKNYADQEVEDLAKLFENWIDLEQTELLAGKIQKYKNLQALIQAWQGLRQNLNKKLILEKLFLELEPGAQ